MFKAKVVGLLFQSDGRGDGGFVEVLEVSIAEGHALYHPNFLLFGDEVVARFDTVYAAI